MNEFQMHYAEWKEQDSKDYILPFIWHSSKQLCRDKNKAVTARLEVAEGADYKGMWRNFGGEVRGDNDCSIPW